MQKKTNVKKINIMNIIIALMIAIILIIAITFPMRMSKVQKQNRVIEQKIQVANEKIEQQKIKNNMLDDPQYQENEVRNDYSRTKGDEKVIILPNSGRIESEK